MYSTFASCLCETSNVAESALNGQHLRSLTIQFLLRTLQGYKLTRLRTNVIVDNFFYFPELRSKT